MSRRHGTALSGASISVLFEVGIGDHRQDKVGGWESGAPIRKRTPLVSAVKIRPASLAHAGGDGKLRHGGKKVSITRSA